MVELMARQAAHGRHLPGVRRVHGLTVITVRHFPGDTRAAEAIRAQGLVRPNSPDELIGNDPWLAWRSPNETIALAFAAQPLAAVLAALAPGQSESAMAANLSDALAVFELHGPRLDDWLAHLVDAAAIPRVPGRCTRCSLADVAVMLLRLESERLWLLVDVPVGAYVENWLALSHEGAFFPRLETGP
jgi:sarcosine oxidase gamma subunit